MRPHIPFSFFDFKFIEKWNPPFRKRCTAAAGAAINEVIYTVPAGKMALLLAATIEVTKTTGTILNLMIYRAKESGVPANVKVEYLIQETASGAGAVYSFPSGKATNAHVLGWHICVLFGGDRVWLTHGLTAAETIQDDVVLSRIEYVDPRFIEKA